MKFITLLTVIAILLIGCDSAEFSAFKVYEKGGEKVNLLELRNKLEKTDIILFGELHNNAMAHWLELQLTKELHKEIGDKLIIGAEMFETDTQLMIDEYFEGLYPTKNFEDEAKLWKNYTTDYKPILEYARKNKLRFVATNIPRRYAALVSRQNLDKLNDLGPEAKKYIAPLPIKFDPELPAYKEMLQMGTHSKEVKYFAEAQAIKDATMAHFIIRNFKAGHKFLHFHGAYHSDNFQGIYWYLKQYQPNLNILTITTIETSNLDSLAEMDKNKADFIILIKDDFTKTY